MSYKYHYEGSNGGYPLEEIKQPKPDVKCDLCGDVCIDFKLEAITATLSIIVCRDCYEADPVEYQSSLEFYKTL